MTKTVLGECFLVPRGDHVLTYSDFELSPSNIRRQVGANLNPESVVIAFKSGEQVTLAHIYSERKKGKTL